MVAKFLAHVAKRNSCRFTPPLVFALKLILNLDFLRQKALKITGLSD